MHETGKKVLPTAWDSTKGSVIKEKITVRIIIPDDITLSKLPYTAQKNRYTLDYWLMHFQFMVHDASCLSCNVSM